MSKSPTRSAGRADSLQTRNFRAIGAAAPATDPLAGDTFVIVANSKDPPGGLHASDSRALVNNVASRRSYGMPEPRHLRRAKDHRVTVISGADTAFIRPVVIS